METKTHWKKVFNSDFLGSCDLEDGTDLKAVIATVTIKEVKGSDGTKKECNVAEFTDKKIKPMILNATNCKMIKKFTKSSYLQDWRNVPVQIYVDPNVKAFGETTEGLRIRSNQPNLSKPKLLKTMPAWGKVVEYLSKDGHLSEIEKKYDISDVVTDLENEVMNILTQSER